MAPEPANVAASMRTSYSSSTAPASQRGPFGRVTPRWSAPPHTVRLPLMLTAGLSGDGSSTSVGPPAFTSSLPSSASTPRLSTSWVKPHSVPDSTFQPWLASACPPPQLDGSPWAMLSATMVERADRTPESAPNEIPPTPRSPPLLRATVTPSSVTRSSRCRS